eukprot:387274-Karenia_brevis.AAC.1
MTGIPNYSGPLGFLALGTERTPILKLRCLHLYAVYTTVARLNALRASLNANQQDIYRTIRERWQYILGRSASLRAARAYVLANAQELRLDWEV